MKYSSPLLLLFFQRFIYALLIPVILISILSTNWIQIRKEVLADHLREHQREQIRRLEAFYEQRFQPVLQTQFLNAFNGMKIPINQSPKEWFHLYGREFLPGLGFPEVSDKNSERNSPVRLIFAPFPWKGNKPPRNLQEVVHRSLKIIKRIAPFNPRIGKLLEPARTDRQFQTWTENLKQLNQQGELKLKNFSLRNLMNPERYYLRDEVVNLRFLDTEEDWFLASPIFSKLIQSALVGGEDSPIFGNFLFGDLLMAPIGGIATGKETKLEDLASRFFTHTAYPQNFDFETYNRNQSPPPQGMLFGMIHKERVNSQFLKILEFFLNAREKGWGSQEAVQRYFLSRKVQVHLVSDPVQQLLKEMYSLTSTPASIKSTPSWSITLSYLFGMDSAWIQYRNHLWLTKTSLRILSPNTPPDAIGNIESDESGYERFRNHKAQRFAFTFQDHNREYEATFFRSNTFKNVIFYLGLDSQTAYQELVLIQLRAWISLFLTIALILISGYFLHRRIPLALTRLNREVQEFSTILFSGQFSQTTTPFPENAVQEIIHLRKSFHSMGSKVRERLFEVSSFNEINQELVRGTDLEILLKLGCERIGDILGSPLCAIVVYEALNSERIIESQAFDSRSRSDGELREIFQLLSARANLVTQPTPLENLNSRINLNSPFLFPLKLENAEVQDGEISFQLQGILLIDGYQPERISKEQNEFLHSFLSQLRTILNKAYLEKVRQDNVIGNQIQMDLMPSKAPVLAGVDISFHFSPANYLGGDFLDFLSFSNGESIGMVVSDVSGKGIGPALLGASTRAYLQSFRQPHEPGEILQKTNTLLCPRTSPGLFVTAFLGIIHPGKKILEYAAAGHNMMIHYSSEESQIHHLDTEDFPLALSSEFTYTSQKVHFAPNDLLVLYTDGLVDAHSPDGEDFGTQRLEELIIKHAHLSSTEIEQKIQEELKLHSRGTPYPDDITYIILKSVALS